MTKEDIIRMAREAHKELVTKDYPGHLGQLDPWTMRLIERFAALVRAAEREACAKVCMDKKREYEQRAKQPADIRDIDPQSARIAGFACHFNAAAIRARGQA